MDPLTIAACVALVVVVASVNFVVDTMLWRHDEAGRIWSMALASGMGGVVAEVFWVATHLTWFVVVVDILYVYGWMLIWSGLRVYNGRSPQFALAAVPAVVAGATALVPQPFSTTPGTFISAAIICVASVLITRETFVGNLRRKRFARPFTFAYASMAAYTGGLVWYGVAEPEANLKDPGFFSMGSYLLVIMLIVVIAVANATLLRAEGIISSLVHVRGVPWDSLSAGVWGADEFSLIAHDWLRRAHAHSASMALFMLELDDTKTIARAFSRDEYLGVLKNWQSVVHDSAPPHAHIAELTPTRMALLVPLACEGDVASRAERLRAGLLESTQQFPVGFHPTMSIGIALADEHDWEYSRLEAAAVAALSDVSRGGGDDARIAAQEG